MPSRPDKRARKATQPHGFCFQRRVDNRKVSLKNARGFTQNVPTKTPFPDVITQARFCMVLQAHYEEGKALTPIPFGKCWLDLELWGRDEYCENLNVSESKALWGLYFFIHSFELISDGLWKTVTASFADITYLVDEIPLLKVDSLSPPVALFFANADSESESDHSPCSVVSRKERLGWWFGTAACMLSCPQLRGRMCRWSQWQKIPSYILYSSIHYQSTNKQLSRSAKACKSESI